MNEFQLHGLIRGVLVPGGVAGVIYLLARFVPSSMRQSFRAAGLVAGLAVSYLLLLGMPHWPVTGSPNGLWSALLLVAVWSTFEQYVDRRIWFKRYLGVVLVAICVLRPLVIGLWDTPTSAQTIAIISAVATLIWFVVERAADRMKPAAAPLAMIVIATGAAAMMFFEGSASLAQLTGAWCATMGAVAVLSLWPLMNPGREYQTYALLTGVALWVGHAYFVDTLFENWMWIALGFSWLVLRAFVRWQLPLKRDLLFTFLFTALPIGIGVFRAYGRFTADGGY